LTQELSSNPSNAKDVTDIDTVFAGRYADGDQGREGKCRSRQLGGAFLCGERAAVGLPRSDPPARLRRDCPVASRRVHVGRVFAAIDGEAQARRYSAVTRTHLPLGPHKPGFLGRGQRPVRSRNRCRTRPLLVLEYRSEDSKRRNLRLCQSETNGTAAKDGLCASDCALRWNDASPRRFISCDPEIDSVDSVGKIVLEKLHWKLLVLVSR
jgi:hypothetical protein